MNESPSPAKYNHSVKPGLLNRILLVMSFVGLYVAGLLTLEKLLGLELPCGGEGGGCSAVANHPTAFWFGIPVALFGFSGYVVLAGLSLMRSSSEFSSWKPLTQVGVAVSGFGALMSLYLQYTSFFVIRAFCPYCMTSAITMWIIFISHILLLQSLKEPGASVQYSRKLDALLPAVLAVAVVTVLSVQATMLKQSTGAVALSEDKKDVQLIPDKNRKQFGPDDAPITIVEFADLCCPSCQVQSPKLKKLAMDHPGKLRIIYRHFPLPMHVQGVLAASMGEYAADKGKFWEFAMALMAKQEEPKEVEELMNAAKAAGLDIDDMIKRLDNENDPIYGRVQMDKKAANDLGVSSTPTFIVMMDGQKSQVAKAAAVFTLLDAKPYKQIIEGK